MPASRLALACALSLVSCAAFGASSAAAVSSAGRPAGRDFDHRAPNARANVPSATRAARERLRSALGPAPCSRSIAPPAAHASSGASAAP